MKIGVITDCFKRPLNESLKLAGELGFNGVQIYATTGEFSPESLTAEKKQEIKELLAAENLEISALCGDMGGHVVASGTPEEVAQVEGSYTGQYLKQYL